jgi:hypothetical protein
MVGTYYCSPNADPSTGHPPQGVSAYLKFESSWKFQVLAVLKEQITKAGNEPSTRISNEAATWRQAIRDAYKREDSHLAEISLTATPLSASFRIPTIWLSVNRDFFI